MSFFDSEVVRASLTEIGELQEEVYGKVFNFPSMSKEDKKHHVSSLEKLLEKQRILYARLTLSDDPEAKGMKEQILESAAMMGLSKDVDMSLLFRRMSESLALMKNQIDIMES